MSIPCFSSLSHRPPPHLSSPSPKIRISKLRKASVSIGLNNSKLVHFPSNSSFHKWKISCFRNEESSSDSDFDSVESKLPEESVSPGINQSNVVKDDWLSKLRKITEAVFSAEPWTVPWTAKTILQVMFLWVITFWLVGSWIIPFLAHTSGFRKDSLTYRGQALYSFLTDLVEGVAGIAILRHCLARFRPLPSDWFRFSLRGKWLFEVGLGCLMFPLVNRLSQVNLSLLPMLPSTPVTVSNVEQSIFARDPVAMVLYFTVVSVCAPIWEEVVFRGFLLPSLTKYMPVWCSILVSSMAFALAHFSVQRMLPLVFLGVVLGAVFARSRNLLTSMLLHSLWNAFVFIDLMK